MLIQRMTGEQFPVQAEEPMPAATFTYRVDLSGLPPGFDENGFIEAVNRNITLMGIPEGAEPVLRSGVTGMLLLDGNSDPTAVAFGDQIRNRLWNYIQTALVDSDGVQVVDRAGNPLTNTAAFKAVSDVIASLRPNQNAYYQELATAARQIIDGQRGAIIGDPILLSSAVQVALQGYGAGTSTQGSFELPPLSGPTVGGGTDEIIPDHVRGVAVWAAGHPLELMGLFKVVDRNVEIFMNGQLPVSNDMGGNALNAYYWDAIHRMPESGRWMQYSRILGAKGGEVSREAPVNAGWDDLFMRFISALSEYSRQQRVADLLGNGRALNITGEHVRKAGRDLAANCTLYGYGYTQFGAKKLQQHIQTALNILKLPDIQQAWGVQSAWQVVERVSSQEFKTTPNVVKYRTLAESGKRILDLVAKNSAAWSSISDKPLFPTPTTNGSLNGAQGSDISAADQYQFMRHAEYLLAVKGTKDAEVLQSSQPSDTATSPSIPSLDGASGATGTPDIAGQIQQMLQQGQLTPDQVRHMAGI
jgi:hypothetical protein